MKKFWKSPWTLTIAGALLGFVLSIIKDMVTGEKILSTISSIFVWLWSVLNINIRVWWLLIGLALAAILRFSMKKIAGKEGKHSIEKVKAFIEQGLIIEKEEYHTPPAGLIMPAYIAGPKYDIWMSEIEIFADRKLKKHTLYDKIVQTCKHHNKCLSAHSEMMGYLRTLESDVEFWGVKKVVK